MRAFPSLCWDSKAIWVYHVLEKGYIFYQMLLFLWVNTNGKEEKSVWELGSKTLPEDRKSAWALSSHLFLEESPVLDQPEPDLVHPCGARPALAPPYGAVCSWGHTPSSGGAVRAALPFSWGVVHLSRILFTGPKQYSFVLIWMNK